MTVNLLYKPFYEVERRKYRFRILNGSVSRFFKTALSDGSEIVQIGNDGNLLPQPVRLAALDERGLPNATTSSSTSRDTGLATRYGW